MLEFPTTPNRHKNPHDTHDESPTPSIKNSPSTASLKSKRTASLHSPGKLVKKVKNTLRRLGDHVTHPGHKRRSPSESSALAAIVPLTTNPLLAPIGGAVEMASTHGHGHADDDDDATSATPPLAMAQPERRGGTAWEEQEKRVARRSRSLSFISGFFPRTRTSSRAESVSTTTAVEEEEEQYSVSDSGTLAGGEPLAPQRDQDQDAEEKAQVEPVVDPPQYHLVIVEAEEEQVSEGEEEQMDRDQSGPVELPSVVDEEAKKDMEGAFPSDLIITEPEVPDPFLVDEEGDALSEEERNATNTLEETVSESRTPAHEISLLPQEATTAAAEVPPFSPSPAADKDVPPLPTTDSEKEEAPELFVPALIAPSMFLPIPNVRRSFIYNHLTWYLSRSIMYYMYPRRTP
jgi:hypothetical protein